jgi:hypothetical protein
MDIVKILEIKYPNTKWALSGTDYAGLEWLDETPKPTEAELKKVWSEVKYESEINLVKQARHAAYTAPSGSDAVLAKYLRDEATKREWLEAVEAINDAHPYPVK